MKTMMMMMISARNYAHACPNTDAHRSRLLLVCCSGQNKSRPAPPLCFDTPLHYPTAPVESDVTWLDMGVLPGPHLDELYRDRRLSHAAAADDHQFVRLHLHFPVYFDQLASEIFYFPPRLGMGKIELNY